MENKSEYLKNLGTDAFNKRDFALAIYHFNNALELNPRDTDLLNNRAICYSELKQFEDALEDITNAIIISPNEALYYSTRSAILMKAERYSDALKDIDIAIYLNTTLEYVTNKVVVLKKMGKFREALDLIESIESQGFGSPEITFYKGILLMNLQSLEQAISIFKSLASTEQGGLAKHYLRMIEQIIVKKGNKL